MAEPGSSTPTVGELQSTLAELTKERERALSQIHEARMAARRISLESAACHQPVAQATIDKWQRDIKERYAELLAIDGKIGETNKQLRATKAANNRANNRTNNRPIKSFHQLTKEAAASYGPETGLGVKPGRVLFLEFFHQLVGENLDPRMVEVLEKDAHDLVTRYREVHGWEEKDR